MFNWKYRSNNKYNFSINSVRSRDRIKECKFNIDGVNYKVNYTPGLVISVINLDDYTCMDKFTNITDLDAIESLIIDLINGIIDPDEQYDLWFLRYLILFICD